MSSQPGPNSRTPSTTYGFRKVRISRRPAGSNGEPAEGRPPRLPERSLREPLTITVAYRGGSATWWLMKARGREWCFPGWMQLHDCLDDIYQGNDQWRSRQV